jgi:hypothetical protein
MFQIKNEVDGLYWSGKGFSGGNTTAWAEADRARVYDERAEAEAEVAEYDLTTCVVVEA